MEFASQTDETLLAEAKKMKTTSIYDAGIFGFLIGVSAYSAYMNGFGWLSFLALVYVPVANKNRKRKEALEAEIRQRGLR